MSLALGCEAGPDAPLTDAGVADELDLSVDGGPDGGWPTDAAPGMAPLVTKLWELSVRAVLFYPIGWLRRYLPRDRKRLRARG